MEIEGLKGTVVTVNWSILYDGKSVLDMMKDRPNVTFEMIKHKVISEGGYIDKGYIIHRGSAEDKVVTLE